MNIHAMDSVKETDVVAHPISNVLETRQPATAIDKTTDLFSATVDDPEVRMQLFGIETLSDGELMALLIGGADAQETASRLLAHSHGLRSLNGMPASELQQIHGIGTIDANRIPAAIELARRLLIPDARDRRQIRSPDDVVRFVRSEMAFRQQEVLYTLTLDITNTIKTIRELYVGNLNCMPVRLAELFREAICTNSASLILVHNHPSGDPTPSPDDVHITEVAVKAGQLLDIDVLDHIIIGQGNYVSMRERSLGFS